jgi:hypothetical protein
MTRIKKAATPASVVNFVCMGVLIVLIIIAAATN